MGYALWRSRPGAEPTARAREETAPAALLSVAPLLFAIVMTRRIRPDRPIDAIPNLGHLALAGGR